MVLAFFKYNVKLIFPNGIIDEIKMIIKALKSFKKHYSIIANIRSIGRLFGFRKNI